MLNGNDNSQNEELTTHTDNGKVIDISKKHFTEDKFESLEINVEKENILSKHSYYDDAKYDNNENVNPRKLGNTFAYWYKNGEPSLIIGPDCNYYFNNSYYSNFNSLLFLRAVLRVSYITCSTMCNTLI